MLVIENIDFDNIDMGNFDIVLTIYGIHTDICNGFVMMQALVLISVMTL